jgi:hypothetical protein
MLHSLSELKIVIWLVAEVGFVLFLICDHACKECSTPGLKKTSIHKEVYQQVCVVKLSHFTPSRHREYVEVYLYR